jgi:uncharacterized membrane protein YraQ (UPF0718 family)
VNVIGHALIAGLAQALSFFWDSLFGLIFGFLVSATVQVVLTPAQMERYLGPKLRNFVYGAGFGIIASACSYGAAAAARGFYRRGADVRSIFAFLISSTNMNLAILILFWSLLGWRFAFAEFFGGVIIIAVVAAGFTLLFGNDELERLRAQAAGTSEEEEHAHCHHHDEEQSHASTWAAIAQTAIGDVKMLRVELAFGYLVAGFAAALIPPAFLAHALRSVGAVPFIGYVLLLLVGLAIAVVTFVCSMGNVPIARFLANARIPLGANIAFIYGDLLIPPLIVIYRKSFPPRVTWTFLALFLVGALIAGAVMNWAVGNALGGATMGSMAINDRFTVISNAVAILAAVVVGVAAAGSAKRLPAA